MNSVVGGTGVEGIVKGVWVFERLVQSLYASGRGFQPQNLDQKDGRWQQRTEKIVNKTMVPIPRTSTH
jgi:hypothetical protein